MWGLFDHRPKSLEGRSILLSLGFGESRSGPSGGARIPQRVARRWRQRGDFPSPWFRSSAHNSPAAIRKAVARSATKGSTVTENHETRPAHPSMQPDPRAPPPPCLCPVTPDSCREIVPEFKPPTMADQDQFALVLCSVAVDHFVSLGFGTRERGIGRTEVRGSDGDED